MLTREITEDVLFKVAQPKKGALMVVEMVVVHHNPHVSCAPDEFRPSRSFFILPSLGGWYDAANAEVSMLAAWAAGFSTHLI